MSPQEIFTTSVTALWKQGRRAGRQRIGSSFVCQYLADDGARCAVGWLLDDDTARLFDSYSDTSIAGIPAEDLPEWMLDNMELLVDLQSLHDDYLAEVSDFLPKAAEIADRHGLEMPDLYTAITQEPSDV